MPPGRIGHTVTVNDEGIVYLWGGVNENLERGSKYLDDFYRYDAKKREWTQVELKEDKPCGRAFHSAVMHNGCMLIFGGCNGRGRFNQIFSINGDTGVCQLVQASGEVPSTRCVARARAEHSHTAATCDCLQARFQCAGTWLVVLPFQILSQCCCAQREDDYLWRQVWW